MTYDFDTPVNRLGTDCLKFDRPEKRGRSSDMLSLWVADMDFPTAPEIVEAICARTRHGIFGYTEPGTAYFAALDSWLSEHYGWHAFEDEVTITPGVVYALAMAICAFTKPGEGVIVQQPVYYPFSLVVEENDRKVVNAPLVYDGQCGGNGQGRNGYRMDFDALERAAAKDDTKLLLLCNPHNPVGRVWNREELQRVSDICLRNGVLVVSDEIHMDFTRPGFTHTPFVTLGEEHARNCVTCTSASKTFNLAGLQTANVIIADKSLRNAFRVAVAASGLSQANTLGAVATQAAYERGGEWLAELKDYLEGNWEFLGKVLAERAPELYLVPAESTYLAWIDCSALGMGGLELERFIEDEAGLWLDCGHIFGPSGDSFIRINIATQRSYLDSALARLCDAVQRRRL